MAEAPRTFWQFLKGNWHTFELEVLEDKIEFRIIEGENAAPRIDSATLRGFLAGELQMKISELMSFDTMQEALVAAKWRLSQTQKKKFNNDYLNELLADSKAFQPNFQASLGKLTVEQLNWKPNAESWSVGECLDHLITTNRSYFAQFSAMSKGDKYESFWEKLPLFHGFWGKMLLNTVSGGPEKKAKSPRPFQPTRSTLPANVLAEYVQNHAEMIRLIEATDHLDHETTMLTSPAATFITYSLKYAVQILLVHEKRHYHQAAALTKMAGFPKNA